MEGIVVVVVVTVVELVVVVEGIVGQVPEKKYLETSMGKSELVL